VTAKTRVVHVNVFNEDKRLNILSVFLNSDGIYFGSKRSKQDTMAEILGNLCWASSYKQDLMSILFYSEFEQLFVKPTKDKQTLWHTVERALDLNPGEVNLKSTNNKTSGFFKINSKLKNQYALKMKQHDDKLYKNFIASNIRYQKIYTSDDVVKKLQKLLTKR